MKSKVYNQLSKILNNKKSGKIGLIDPDKKNPKSSIIKQIEYINSNDYCCVFIGGSLIMDSKCNEKVNLIKKNTDLPVIGFISSSSQINKNFDAILFLSLVSGRNPHYLIGEHVIASPIINDMDIEVIPVGYILIDGGKKTSVEIISNTNPLPMDNHDIIIAHALASQYLGHKFIYIESGSNSSKIVDSKLISCLKKYIEIPLIVGGGIKNKSDVKQLLKSGADFVVTGTMIENSC
ncbi:MAG: phosphoglycerol geranylgeranyltransferase [Candidatus Marinimicrobia bacterium]|nr:phosphoglycerol geranylgeranyltransferase [Candidatus Neomarinimicrobiota bacterium]|tara:strand:+ start:950 stop:1657 length:708 start_codon:yes stop_codon:yes gene_type:complete